jgi:autotransporter translocation and assembly factor TamB
VKFGAGLLLVLVVGAVGGAVMLTRTPTGQAFLIEQALSRIEGTFNGEITISGLRSRGLHREVRLLGLRLTAPDGSPVLAVDSAEARYSIQSVLGGEVALAGLTLWRPRLTIAKAALDRPFNLRAFLDGGQSLGPESSGEGESGRAEVVFLLDEVEVRDGTIEVRYPLSSPADPSSPLITESGPDGQGVQRVFGFHGIDGRFEGVVLGGPDSEGIRMNVTGLSFEGDVFEESIEVRDFEGRVVWGGDRVSVETETMNVLGGTANGSAIVELVEGSAPDLTVEAFLEDVDLLDLRWLEPRLPDVRISGRLEVDAGVGGQRAGWSDLSLAIGGGRIAGRGAVSRASGGEPTLEDVALELSGVRMSLLEEYITVPIPLEGRLSGSLGLSGTMDSVTVVGRMDLVEPGLSPMSGEVNGVFHTRREGVTGLTARLTDVDLRLVDRVADGLSLEGSVNLDIQADGWLDTGLQLVVVGIFPGPGADPGLGASYVSLAGSLVKVDGGVRIALDGQLDPFSIDGIVPAESSILRLGVVRGTVHAEGAWSNLTLQSDLLTERGRLTLESRFDARAPFTSYQVRSEAYDFDPSQVAPWLPEGTIVSGSFDLRGEGGDLRTAALVGSVGLGESRLAGLAVDTVSAELRISNGIVTMDGLQGRIGGVTLEGAGQLAVEGDGGPENVRLSFQAESLEGLRPLVRGGDVIAGDTLSALERQVLEFEGIDPDTLPTLAEVLTSGRMAGELTATGSLSSLSVVGRAGVEEAFYGGDRVGQAEVSFAATGLFSNELDIRAQVDAGAISVFERQFDSVSATLAYRESSGSVNVFLVRSPEEDYSGRLALDVEGEIRTLHLDELVFRFPDERWNLGGPATISWDPDGLTFRDLRMRRPGVGGMRLQAQGRIPFDGEADFALEAESLDIRRIVRLLQSDEVLEGVVDLTLDVTGSDDEPVMNLVLSTDGFRFRDYVVDQVEAEVSYSGRTAEGDVAVWNDSIRVLTVVGEVPLDLSFNPVEERFPEEVIDLVVESDRLPLSLVMAPFPGYEQVEGTISGSVEVGGTSRTLTPQGQLTVDEGGVFLTGVGVRHEDVGGTLDWFPDGRVEVNLGARALGTAAVEGTVSLTTALDPGFDLGFRFDDFQAMDRRDATGRVSGDLRLEGSFSRPVVSGDLFLDGGTLFYDEFLRAVQVADLFFERSPGLADLPVVDATSFGFIPLVAGGNPFLQNIRLENTTLTARRDNWIRSEEMNVELEGDLDVLYDRQSQDLTLVGALQAVRGSLTFGPLPLRKQFQVDGGTLRFLGTPGINPDLDLTASEPVRTPEGDRLTITASVTGTLISPQLALTSDETGFTEDDLLSYLWFGRPTYALTADQSGAVGAARAVGLSAFSSGLGSVMTQQLGFGFLDYLSVTQQDLASGGSFGANGALGALGATVVEAGRYIADDLFLTVLFRPRSSQNSGFSAVPGVRLEWVSDRGYTIQSYLEDQFFRGRAAGFGELGVQSSTGVGLSIFRDWSY